MAETPEGKVKRKIRQWVKDHMPGSWHYAPRGGPFGKSGVPDDLWLWRGVFFAIEAKSGEDRDVTSLQKDQLRKIRSAGGISAILRGYEEHKLETIKQMILERTPMWGT